MTFAEARECPQFKMPRRSLLSFRKLSTSSTSKVGCIASTILKTAAAVMLEAGSGRRHIALSTVMHVVFPLRFVGDVTSKSGATSNESKQCEYRDHKARAV